MERLRILMLAPQFRPLVGGYEKAAERLAAELAARGHAVTVVAERRDRAWPAFEQGDGYAIRRLRCIHRRGLHGPSSLLVLALFLVRHWKGFDVIHVHRHGWPIAACLLAGGIWRVPVVLKITSTGSHGLGASLGAERLAALQRWLHRRVDAFVATSQRVADELEQFGAESSQIVRIPNGIDTDRFSPVSPERKRELKRELGVRADLLVLYVGRLSEVKDPGLLLEAWSELQVREGGAQLVLLGDGPLREPLQAQLAAGGPDGGAVLAGAVDEPRDWYRAADVYVLPSRREGLSNSLLEALSAGLPVVSTRVSGSTDVFARVDVGALVDVGDAHALRRAIDTLLDDPERRRLCGERARAFAEREFSIGQVAHQTEQLYRRLAVA